MVSVKIFVLLFSVALAAGINAEMPFGAEEFLTCNAHGQLHTGQKTCFMKCNIGCTEVSCGLYNKCEKVISSKGTNENRYKCLCNFGIHGFPQ